MNAQHSGGSLRMIGTVAVTAVLFSVVSGSAGAPQDAATATASRDAVAGTTAKWTAAFRDDNPDAILALYDDEGVLWGTLSPTIAVGRPSIRGYFERAYKALPGHTVTLGEQKIRVYGDTAINSGSYTFSFVRDGEVRTIPARYSFVYRKRGNDWMIVDHHSSAMPPPQ